MTRVRLAKARRHQRFDGSPDDLASPPAEHLLEHGVRRDHDDVVNDSDRCVATPLASNSGVTASSPIFRPAG
jgi:hypothetical protein